MANPKNIIIVVVDTLRASNLGCYGYPVNTSPNIDKLAKESVVFEDAYACSVKTDPAFTSIASGLYPTTHGILNHANRIKPQEMKKIGDIVFLAQTLKDKGYKCFGLDFLSRWHKRGFDYYLGIEGSPRSKRGKIIDWLREKFNIKPGTGIQRFFEKTFLYNLLLRIVFANKSTPYLPADKLVDRALDILKKDKSEKKFMFLHFWDPHKPYWPPQRYIDQLKDVDYLNIYPQANKSLSEIRNTICSPLSRFFFDQMAHDKDKTEELIRAYDAEIKFLDDNLGRLLKQVSKDDLLIFTADHGESLVEHNNYFCHEGLYQLTLRIPFILRFSGLAPKKVSGLVQSVDIMPTVLDFLGDKFDKEFDGKSLRLLMQGEPLREVGFAIDSSGLRRQAAVFTKEYKYIAPILGDKNICEYCRCQHGFKEALFDLTNDPGEVKNIIKEFPDIAQKYKKMLNSFFDKTADAKGLDESFSQDSDDENDKIKKRLQDLGYF